MPYQVRSILTVPLSKTTQREHKHIVRANDLSPITHKTRREAMQAIVEYRRMALKTTIVGTRHYEVIAA